MPEPSHPDGCLLSILRKKVVDRLIKVKSVNAHQQSFASGGNDFCRHAGFLVEVRCVLHESVISRQSIQRYILADAVQTCSGATTPNGKREKHVVAHTRTDVYLASLNIEYLCRFSAGVTSSRYELHIVTTWPALRYVEDREYRSLIHPELGFDADGRVAPEWLPERSHDSSC